MTKIRKLYFYDKKNIQEMISFLNNTVTDNYMSNIMFNPFIFIHHYLPLNCKFLPESYVLQDDKNLKGMITVAPVNFLRNKMEIQKLLFEENAYDYASELVQFAVAKYKALGASSVIVKVDDYLSELLEMFVIKCGFTKISSEKIWRIDKFSDAEYNKENFRPFVNSDAEKVNNLYNASVVPHIRPLLNKEPKEFKDNMFKGLSCFCEYKYVIEDKQANKILAYISIKTVDNINYIADIIQEPFLDIDTNGILHFISDMIKKRKKRFGLFLRTKQYDVNNSKYDEIMLQNEYELVKTQFILTNSSAKILKEDVKSGKYMMLGDFCPQRIIRT